MHFEDEIYVSLYMNAGVRKQVASIPEDFFTLGTTKKTGFSVQEKMMTEEITM